MKRYLLPLLAATLLASGCASTPAPTTKAAAAPQAPVAKVDTSSAIQEENAKAAIAAAEKSRDAAAAVGFEWRDTSQMIDDAKKSLAEKEFDKAIKLANQAERQGAIAVKQSAIETERLSKMK
jgi:hypothetical protein